MVQQLTVGAAHLPSDSISARACQGKSGNRLGKRNEGASYHLTYIRLLLEFIALQIQVRLHLANHDTRNEQ